MNEAIDVRIEDVAVFKMANSLFGVKASLADLSSGSLEVVRVVRRHFDVFEVAVVDEEGGR